MFFDISLLLVGLVLLVWSADRFVEGSAAVGRTIGIPSLVIGLTIVSVGTSAPEIFVAIIDSIQSEPQLAIGNAIGSNICNIGLVLGITALVVPLPFSTPILNRDLPWLLGISLLVALLFWDMHLGRLDGLILIAILGFLLAALARSSLKAKRVPERIREELEALPEMPVRRAVMWTLLGGAILVASAHLVVVRAESLAEKIGVSETVIGLTVVAVGTSLPELAATLRAAMKGHAGIAIGNILGSNVLNILAALSVPALLNPTALDRFFVIFDYGAMLGFTVFLALFAYGVGSTREITRPKGIALIAGYIGFYCVLGLAS